MLYFLSSTFSSFTSFFFLPNYRVFRYSIVRHVGQWTYLCRFSKVENSRSLQLVSEQWFGIPWLWWDLLIRDRVSSTLEWVLRVMIDMSAYLLVNIKLFYIALVGLLSGIWILVGTVWTTVSIGVSKHLDKTIRHGIVLKWVNEIIFLKIIFLI